MTVYCLFRILLAQDGSQLRILENVFSTQDGAQRELVRLTDLMAVPETRKARHLIGVYEITFRWVSYEVL